MNIGEVKDFVSNLVEERNAAEGRAAELQAELASLAARCKDLSSAIASLSRLHDLAHPADPQEAAVPGGTELREVLVLDDDQRSGSERETPPVPSDSRAARSDDGVDETLRKYQPEGGGSGKRLRSTAMVKDVMVQLDRVVTRAELMQAFFEQFNRDSLAAIWQKPDNALNNAISRAAKDGMILRAGPDSFGPVSVSHGPDLADRARPITTEARS